MAVLFVPGIDWRIKEISRLPVRFNHKIFILVLPVQQPGLQIMYSYVIKYIF